MAVIIVLPVGVAPGVAVIIIISCILVIISSTWLIRRRSCFGRCSKHTPIPDLEEPAYEEVPHVLPLKMPQLQDPEYAEIEIMQIKSNDAYSIANKVQ